MVHRGESQATQRAAPFPGGAQDRPAVIVAPLGVDLHGLVPRDLRPRAGFALPAAPWSLRDRGWACLGTIADRAEAEAALTAALRGVALVVSIALEPPGDRQVLDDLTRVGSLLVADRGRAPEDSLTEEQRALLGLLADGHTIIEAASRLGWSRRTMSRRMHEIRQVLDARTTAEAVARWAAAPGGDVRSAGHA